MGALSHSDQKSLYVRIGNASRRRDYGCAGAVGGTGGVERCELGMPLCTSVSFVVNEFRLPQRTQRRTEEDTEECRTLAISSSSAVGITASSPLSIWLAPGSGRWFWSAGTRSAVLRSRENSIRDSGRLCWRIPPARFAPKSSATCIW